MIIATFVPHNFFMSFEVVKCFLGVPKLPDIGFAYFESCYIDTSRNKALEYAKELDDDILMIDSDMIFSPNDVMKIRNHLRTGTDIITGVYPITMNGKTIPCLYKRMENGLYLEDEVKEGVNEIDACGAGFLGISKNIFSKLPPEPFARLKKEDVVFEEDVSFCQRVKELGMKVLYDSSIKLSQVRTSKLCLN